MNRVAILILLFLAVTLCIVGQALSTFAIWLINRASVLIGFAKDIEP